jgi:hypothetical protein
MIKKWFKYVLAIIGVIIILPFALYYVIFGYAYITSAFPSQSYAEKIFERDTPFSFPESVDNMYFRVAMPSLIDEGGSALEFSTTSGEISKILESNHRIKWSVLVKSFHCDCWACIRYSTPVIIPAGSMYWRVDGSLGDYRILAVNVESQKIFMCARDT